MKATIPYIEQKFEEFNHRIFGGRLPKLPIVLTDQAGALGSCCFIKTNLPDGRVEYGDFELRINTRIDLPETLVEDVIIHEMIHYFIHLHNLVDTAPHGTIFKAIMESVNATHGRNITITHQFTEEQQKESVSTKAVWHVIAAITFKSGETGVKVLPRTMPKIISFYTEMIAQDKIDHIDLYLHNNPFFNQYPTSAALRVYPIETTVLNNNLRGAKRLQIKGNKVMEVR